MLKLDLQCAPCIRHDPELLVHVDIQAHVPYVTFLRIRDGPAADVSQQLLVFVFPAAQCTVDVTVEADAELAELLVGERGVGGEQFADVGEVEGGGEGEGVEMAADGGDSEKGAGTEVAQNFEP